MDKEERFRRFRRQVPLPQRIQNYGPLTLGEARSAARRFRKLGFSPVAIYPVPANEDWGLPAGYGVQGNWPYDADKLPDDLYIFLALAEGQEEDEGAIVYNAEIAVRSQRGVRRVLARYSAVRLGSGSRPLPLPRVNDLAGESAIVPSDRLVTDFDDWPLETHVHPEWERHMQANQGS